MLLKQSKTFYFLWWNKSNIKEIKTTSHFACQINNISLEITNKLKFLGVPWKFLRRMGDLPSHKKDWTKTFSYISRRISKSEKQVLRYWENACPSLTFRLFAFLQWLRKNRIGKHSPNIAKENID